MKNTITKTLAAIALATTMTNPTYAGEPISSQSVKPKAVEEQVYKAEVVEETKPAKDGVFEKGYNDISAGVSAKGDSLVRTISNFSADFDGLKFAYAGLNQVSNGDLDTYLGVHRASMSLLDSPVSAATRIVTTSDGVVDTKYGVQVALKGMYDGNNPLIEALDPEYGFLFLGADENTTMAHTLMGHSLEPIAEMTGIEYIGDMTLETVLVKTPDTDLFWEGKLMKPIGEKAYGFLQYDSNNTGYVGLGFKW